MNKEEKVGKFDDEIFRGERTRPPAQVLEGAEPSHACVDM